MTIRVLVTGFGPFLDHASNPSAMLARALDGRRAGDVALVGHAPLPVVFGEPFERTVRRMRAVGADAVIALGLAARSATVRVERRATNAWTSPHPDVRGVVIAPRPIVPGAPRYLGTALDPAPFSRALAAEGIASTLSDHAGGYVCNELYYRLLHANVPAIFVHVPPGASMRIARPLALGIGASLRGLSRGW